VQFALRASSSFIEWIEIIETSEPPAVTRERLPFLFKGKYDEEVGDKST